METFYKKWLGHKVPCGTGEVGGVEDKSAQILKSWAKETENREATQ